MDKNNPTTKKRDFDKEAATWDTAQKITLAKNIAGAILSQVKLTKEMDVMDFGCGTGLLAFHIQPLVRSVVGVDSSKGMLDAFNTKIRQKDIKNAKTSFVDLSAGDVLNGRYQAIISGMTLHHIEDVPALLKRFFEILTKGGQLALVDLDEEGGLFHENKDGVFHNGFNREKLKGLLTDAGFADIRDTTAAQMTKSAANGALRTFSIFLITGRK